LGVKIPLPRALPQSARQKVEEAIERHGAAMEALIAFLDAADGDSDIEAVCEDEGAQCEGEGDDNELDCSYAETHGKGGKAEVECEDIEHSLGWTGDINQDRALKNCVGIVSRRDGTWFDRGWDLEDQHDGREPSLGSSPCVGYCGEHGASPAHTWDQSWWGGGSSDDDRELADDSNEGDDREDLEGRVAAFETGEIAP